MSDKKTPTRPLPKLTEADTRDFWQATKQKELRYQKCDDCGALVFYPRRHCTGCTSGNLSWHVASGRGRIYTYSVVRQSYHPFFREKAPYIVAWIDLEEGPRLASNVLADDPGTVSIGQEVMLEWEEHEELCIPLFRPI